MSAASNRDLLAGPVRPALLRFAGPVILTMVATQLYTVADTMIIGLCLDANALAAVSTASTALMVFMFISGGPPPPPTSCRPSSTICCSLTGSSA